MVIKNEDKKKNSFPPRNSLIWVSNELRQNELRHEKTGFLHMKKTPLFSLQR